MATDEGRPSKVERVLLDSRRHTRPDPADADPADADPPVAATLRTGRWLGAVGGIVALAVFAAIGYQMLYGSPKPEIVVADVAGGLKRAPEAEGLYAKSFAEWRTTLPRALGNRVIAADIVTAVYRDDSADKDDYLLFIGATGDLGEDTERVVRQIISWGGRPTVSNWDWNDALWGGTYGVTVGDTMGACSGYEDSSTDTSDWDFPTDPTAEPRIRALCTWATENSLGVLISTEMNEDPPDNHITAVRRDLERKR